MGFLCVCMHEVCCCGSSWKMSGWIDSLGEMNGRAILSKIRAEMPFNRFFLSWSLHWNFKAEHLFQNRICLLIVEERAG